jgi:hypothetical protein
VVAVALLARVTAAVAARLVTDTYTIPDETLYVELGRNVLNGLSPDEWYPGYGQSFRDSISAYTEPLILLFRIFGPDRIVGGLFAAVAGAAGAGLTTAIALRFLRAPFAVLAGLIVALMPSQVLFSAVSLREAHVWLALIVVAAGAVLMMSENWRRVAAGAFVAGLALFVLGYLRDQTMVAAAWALALAVLVSPRRLWLPRVVAGVLVAAAAPWLTGAGIGGYAVVNAHAGRLATDRAVLAQGANTAFGGATQPSSEGGAGGAAPTTSAPTAPGFNGTVSKTARDAASRDEGLRASVGHLPVGLVDTALRPFPWQSTSGVTLLFARVETLAWYLLYVLGLGGVVVSLRRRDARLALQFPILVTGMLMGIAALTQGNLGTAFRHREQLLWAFALGAAAFVQWLVLRSRSARPAAGDASEAPASEEPKLAVAADRAGAPNGAGARTTAVTIDKTTG